MKTICTVGIGLMHDSVSKKLTESSLFQLVRCDKAGEADAQLAKADVGVLNFTAEQMKKLAPLLKSDLSQKLLITFADDLPLSEQTTLLRSQKVVRVAANMALKVGKSVSAYYAGAGVTAAEKSAVETVLKGFGSVVEVDSDEKLEAVSGISDCGLVYFYFLTEILEEAGKKYGFTDAESRALAEGVFQGSVEMMTISKMSAKDLNVNLREPGSRAELAVKKLLEEKVHVSFLEAMKSTQTTDSGSFF